MRSKAVRHQNRERRKRTQNDSQSRINSIFGIQNQNAAER